MDLRELFKNFYLLKWFSIGYFFCLNVVLIDIIYSWGYVLLF